MTLYDFMMLDLKEQAVQLFENSIMVATLDEREVYYELYSLGSIFIEIKRGKKANKIVEIAIFKSGNQLEKYLGDLGIIKEALTD